MNHTYELGDMVQSALNWVGISSQRVEGWLGRPCYCEERKQKLNALSQWARRVLSGKTNQADQYLNQIIDE